MALIVQGKMLDSLWANLLGGGLRVLFVNRNCRTFDSHVLFFNRIQSTSILQSPWIWDFQDPLTGHGRVSTWHYLTSWCFHSSSNRSLPELCRLFKNSSKAKRANCPSWTRPKNPSGRVVVVYYHWSLRYNKHQEAIEYSQHGAYSLINWNL